MRRLLPLLLALLASRPALAQDQTAPEPERATEPGAAGEAGDAAPSPARFETGLESRPPARARRGERVEFNLEDGDLMDLVRMMTSITGRRFLLGGTERSLRATIASTQPVSAGEAYQAFLTVLHANGLTVVRRGRYYLVTESDDVERQVLPVYDDGRPPSPDERFVTWIHRVEHVSASEAAQLIDPLRSPEAHVVTYDPTQTLIVIDTGASIRRLRRILREVDVPRSDAQLWVEPIHHASAEELATLLTEIFDAERAEGGAAARPSARRARPARAAQAAQTQPAAPSEVGQATPTTLSILSDPRTNSLILLTNQSTYARIMRLLRVLDVPSGEQLGVHVRRLQHSDAEAVASTLQALLGEGGASAARGQSAQASAPTTVAGTVRIQPHADLNAVVVTASHADYRAIEELVEELDAPPRQVFLEMVLMEVTIDDTNSLDANILSGIAGLFGADLLGLFTSFGTGIDPFGPGTSLSLFGPQVNDPRLPADVNVSEYQVQLQAFAGRTRTNIIATPHILALDNREATINIGQNVPLQGSAVSGTFNPLATALGGSDAAAGQQALSQLAGGSSGGRRDTGTIVTVTPHVNDDGEIRMEIRTEDSRQSGSSGNLDAAVVSQSIAETELVATDGQTVVIGGLIRDETDLNRSGIPILSDIPILGALFGNTQEHTLKRNLLFFVTPHVVRHPRDLRAIMERRLRERRELLEREMAFDDEWEPPVDYARTRGLVGEMLDVVAEVEREAEEAARAPAPIPEHLARPPVDDEPLPGPGPGPAAGPGPGPGAGPGPGPGPDEADAADGQP